MTETSSHASDQWMTGNLPIWFTLPWQVCMCRQGFGRGEWIRLLSYSCNRRCGRQQKTRENYKSSLFHRLISSCLSYDSRLSLDSITASVTFFATQSFLVAVIFFSLFQAGADGCTAKNKRSLEFSPFRSMLRCRERTENSTNLAAASILQLFSFVF